MFGATRRNTHASVVVGVVSLIVAALFLKTKDQGCDPILRTITKWYFEGQKAMLQGILENLERIQKSREPIEEILFDLGSPKGTPVPPLLFE